MSRQASEIKFGVEIECYLPVGTEIAVGGYHSGLQINWAPAGWNGQADGSLGTARPDGYKAVEIVSPPIAGEAGLVEVYYMVETIQDLGGKVNGACGLHVHVDANTLTDCQVKAIRAEFIRLEKTFYGLSGHKSYSRYHSNAYCKRSSQTPNLTDRYQGINLLNYLAPTPRRARNNGKTIEFRVWAGTLDVEEIITAVYMATALVAKVENQPQHQIAIDDPITFSALWSSPEMRIVPDEDCSQLAEYLTKQTAKARL